MIKYFCCCTLLFIYLHTKAQESIPQLYFDIDNAYDAGNFNQCIVLAPEAELILLQRQDTIASNTLHNIGNAYYFLADYPNAIKYLNRDRSLLESIGYAGTERYSQTLLNLSDAYAIIGNYTLALLYAKELVNNDALIFGEQDDNYVSSVIHLITLLNMIDDFGEAEKILQITLRKQMATSTAAANIMLQLGKLYITTGQFTKSRKLLEQSIVLLTFDSENYSDNLINAKATLGNLLMSMGKYAEAEELFEEILAETSPENQNHQSGINNLAVLYQEVGQFDLSEQYLRRLASIDSIQIGVSHPEFSITLSNLGIALLEQDKFSEAEALLLASKGILENMAMQNSISYAIRLNNLAKLYLKTERYDSAKIYLLQSSSIIANALGKKSTQYASLVLNSGDAYLQSNDEKSAEKFYKNAIKIRKQKLGTSHPAYGIAVQKLAELYTQQGKIKKAANLYSAVFENHEHQINSYFAILTEEEKANYYYNNLMPAVNSFLSLVDIAHGTNAHMLGKALDLQLNLKGLILLATDKVKRRIRNSGDTTLINLYEKWKDEKEIIAHMYSQGESPETLQILIRQAATTERELVRKSKSFEETLVRKSYTWKEIQAKIKPGEAAIEVVRYTQPGNESMPVYIFFIITSETLTAPDAIFVRLSEDAEKRFTNYYANSIQFKLLDNYSYINFFDGLSLYLKENQIGKIYFSPDGIYHKLNLNTLYNTKNQLYVFNEFDVIHVNSIRDLLNLSDDKNQNENLVLVGDPHFKIELNEQLSTSETSNINLSRTLRTGLLRFSNNQGSINRLPGTLKEVNEISALLKDKQQTLLINEAATEDALKAEQRPALLHIATHGYFFDDPKIESQSKYKDNPLHYSGLILAGAENYLNTGQLPHGFEEDGILTAYEAVNLDLEGTKLIVLSACETGLGSLRNGEGIYGLQRAFKIAGAENLIMSLWEVDDEATQELMSAFYRNYANATIHEAFKLAQVEIKKKYPEPYYWGAFILLGK
jgi:CHAT domain-containing protein/tetratricopeptide (TPR) repeat protein